MAKLTDSSRNDLKCNEGPLNTYTTTTTTTSFHCLIFRRDRYPAYLAACRYGNLLFKNAMGYAPVISSPGPVT